MSKVLLTAALLLTGCGADDAAPEPAAANQEKKAEAAPAPAKPAAAPAAEAEADAAKVAAADAAPAIDGKAIYSQYCVACHGADGKGNNGLAANYVDDKTRLAQSDEALIKSIKEGKQGSVGVMPPWGGTLNDDQIKAVLGYIRAEFGEQG